MAKVQDEITTMQINGKEFIAKEVSDELVAKASRNVQYADFSGGVFKKGDKVFIRGVSFHYLGRVAYADDKYLVLEDASWVAVPRIRHGVWLEKGPDSNSEIEVYPDPVTLQISTFLDWTPWRHELPKVSSPKK